MRPSAAAVTASSPSSAPVGTMICPPRTFASSMSSGRGRSAPAESTITRFPASSIGRQIRSSTSGRRAFDRKIGVRRKGLGLHQRARDPLGIEPRLRLRAIPAGRAGECQPGQPIRKLAREHAADRAETGDGDTGRQHMISETFKVASYVAGTGHKQASRSSGS